MALCAGKTREGMGRSGSGMSQFPNHLLEQAKELATREKGKPRQASLRRAVSSAYYALFHLLIDEAGALIAGAGPAKSKTDLRRLVGRSFTHTQIKSACVEISKATPNDILKPFWKALDIAHQPELLRLAQTFRLAQEERHRADYDLSQSFTRDEVQTILNRVEQAFLDWKTLKTTRPQIAHFFALSMIMMDSWRKR